MSDKLLRVLRLYQAFVDHQCLTNRAIRERLGVDRKTAWRDVRALQAAGVPIAERGEGKLRRYVLQEPESGIRVRLRVTHASRTEVTELVLAGTDDEVVQKVLAFGSAVEVLSPDWLRLALIGELDRTLSRYRTS